MRILSFLEAALWLFSVVFTVYMCYYILLVPHAFMRKRVWPQHKPKCRFAILVAARNEEAVIGHLVESLVAQEYPSTLFDIYVIPNNCTDRTEQVARQAGAQILECAFPVRSKGDVLRQVVAMILAKGQHDAICVFDADNVVDPGFLQSMNNAWCAGAKAAQGFRDSKNPHDTIISGNYSLYYWMVNRFYSHARNKAGLSAIVNGSGFMADVGLLRSMGGWNTKTLTEDIEFTTKCILQNVRVEWVPQAITYDEQPLTFLQSWRQRCRWSTGTYQCLSLYLLPLVRTLFSGGLHGVRARLDQIIFLLAPLMQLAWLVSLVMGQLLRVLQIHYDLFPSTPLFTQLFLSIAVSYALSLGMSVLVMLLERKPIRSMLRGIFTYWVFIMSWLPINAYCLVHRTTEWKTIAHTRSVKLSQIK